MTMPGTPVLDDFNRGDEGPPLSASWAALYAGGNGLEVDTNEAAGDTVNYNAEYYNVADYGPACEIYTTIRALPQDWKSICLHLRVQDEGGNVDGYALMWFIWAGDTDGVRHHREDNTVWTQLGASDRVDMAVGETMLYRMYGSTMEAWHYTGGTWSLLGSRTDATYASAGKLALGIDDNQGRADDFGGGTWPHQPYSLRGTTVPHTRQWQPGVTR